MFWNKKKNILPVTKRRILFVLKRRDDYSCDMPYAGNKSVSTGMYNSVRMMVKMCNGRLHCDAKMVVVDDNNHIDKEVHDYKPTDVIIEGLWVVPEKMDILYGLYPKVHWYVRIHSEIPFLSQEGKSMEWLHEYYNNGINIACNSPRAQQSLSSVGIISNYLPNFYCGDTIKEDPNDTIIKLIHAQKISGYSDVINIGCFGAIRPLKNQLLQAIVAHRWASDHHCKLNFFINKGRVECGASPIMNNLQHVFDNTDSDLIQIQWMPHEYFLGFLNNIDMCMQVSLSETYNICTADAILMNIPVVVSREIPFVDNTINDPCSANEIYSMMDYVYKNKNKVKKNNEKSLIRYNNETVDRWRFFIS